jgi:hypothetical protein
MRHCAVLLGMVFLLAVTTGAQTTSVNTWLPGSATVAAPAAVLPGTGVSPDLWADSASPGFARASVEPELSGFLTPAAAQQPTVFGVLPIYDWRLYVGYTFFNFQEVPRLTNTENGLDIAVTYFPKSYWIGVEGDLMATFGAQAGCTSRFTLPEGGVRFRWIGPRGIEFWAHGLVGGAYFFPQTAYGSQTALGYEMGGGVDINAHRKRFAYRFEADAVGTRFFHSYQFSPKISAGIVFKF